MHLCFKALLIILEYSANTFDIIRHISVMKHLAIQIVLMWMRRRNGWSYFISSHKSKTPHLMEWADAERMNVLWWEKWLVLPWFSDSRIQTIFSFLILIFLPNVAYQFNHCRKVPLAVFNQDITPEFLFISAVQSFLFSRLNLSRYIWMTI